MKLSDYTRWIGGGLEDFVSKHRISANQIHKSLRYEKLTDVVRVDFQANQFFFFQKGKLKLIYLSDEVLVQELWKEFKRSQNAERPDKTVRSRAGKTANQYVFARQGFTASLTGSDVDFIELYEPCDLQVYLDKIYDEPPRFIR